MITWHDGNDDNDDDIEPQIKEIFVRSYIFVNICAWWFQGRENIVIDFVEFFFFFSAWCCFIAVLSVLSVVFRARTHLGG